GIESAVVRDVGGLRRPRRYRARTRNNEEQRTLVRLGLGVWSVRQQVFELALLTFGQRARDVDEVTERRGDMRNAMLRMNSGKAEEKLGDAKRRQRGLAAQRKDFSHRKRADGKRNYTPQPIAISATIPPDSTSYEMLAEHPNRVAT